MAFKRNNELTDMESGQKPRKRKFRRFVIIFTVIMLIGGVAISAYYFNKYRAAKADPNVEAQRETKKLVAAVGKLMELPVDEVPTAATIADKNKLKDQPFFAKAENGDKLLAYTKSMQAILYRPSTNKIINVAPITIGQQNDTGKDKQTALSLKVAYYNGTGTSGFSSQMEKTVKTAYASYQTVTLTNATHRDYKQTLIVDISGIHQKEALSLANLLGGKVSSLPDGEKRPEADILIVAGK